MINGRGRQLGRPRCPTILPDLRVEFWKRCLDEVTAPQFLGVQRRPPLAACASAQLKPVQS
jgi:hypothetical protein